MPKPRSRFDIVVVFSDGAYVRFTSRKDATFTPQQIADSLREYVGLIENGIKAETKGDAD